MSGKSYRAWLQHEKVSRSWRDRHVEWLGKITLIGELQAMDLDRQGHEVDRSIEDASGRSSSYGVIKSAIEQLVSGIESMLDLKPRMAAGSVASAGLVIGLAADAVLMQGGSGLAEQVQVSGEGYALISRNGEQRGLLLIGGTARGLLYGVFHLLRLVALEEELEDLEIISHPHCQIRMINQWDNMDGSIERGYAGRSIFYRDGRIVQDLSRADDYARLLASVGINAISINNVNVHETETSLISEEMLPEVARLAAVFRRYGIAVYLSINFAAPIQLGGLATADPLDPSVRQWWRERADDIYRHIPDFGGFLVKADSEHRPGPFTYGRDHVDGANMLAEALAPHGGLVIWRCFVYNCMQDWRDRFTDRARAAYDHFKPLDGRFHHNVILQIKNGPMDFQVREPVSPLFGTLERTNQMLEFQITQEYTGQQRHLCYLVTQWKEVVDFDTYAKGPGSTIKRIINGSLFGTRYSGCAAVSNIGDDENWTGHLLAQANLYGYGRLVWDPDLSAERIAEEWTRLTFGNDKQLTDTIVSMLMRSWLIYESYTAPLGVGWMVKPHTHYGPDVDGYEYSRWGTYHYADRDGIGVDRTLATGTGYTGQYHSPNREMYESLATCPDELLLFFHHVPYSHVLHSGKTVIQHIYDTHFDGAEQAVELLKSWRSLEGKMDEERFWSVLSRLEEQVEHAAHWRDVINTYFYRKSGVPDAAGRKIYP